MAVFRLNQKKGTETRPTSGKEDQDWFVSSKIEPSNIHDSEGGKGNEPTSIPSPFARMDLIRTALAYVAEKNMDDKNPQNEGDTTTFHKLVSDYLDVAEIFFNYKNWAGDDGSLVILEWKRSEDLGWLKKSTQKGHRLFGEALELYLSQDKEAFNFGSADSIYLLEYRKNRIIGATSPKTLFFTCGNDLSGIRDLIFPNQDRAFDKVYTPLHMRDHDFQKWFFSLRRMIKDQGLINNFRELNSYLDSTLKKLENGDLAQNKLHDELISMSRDYYGEKNYTKIGDGVYITQKVPLLCAKNIVKVRSDFEMAPTRPEFKRSDFTGAIPLVLKKGHSGKDSMGNPMQYYKSAYVDIKEIGFYDNTEDIFARKLPGLKNITYPYLTVSDFLEPYLIQTNYSLNNTMFFDALRDKPADSHPIGFILPLKRILFDYFSIDDIVYSDRRTQPYIDIKYSGKSTSVSVKLGIPIKNGQYIEFTRLYSHDLRPNLDQNTGMVVERHFTIAVSPFFKLEEKSMNFPRVCLVDRNHGHNAVEASLNFYEETSKKEVEVTRRKRNDQKTSLAAPATTVHHVFEETGFDYLKVAFSDGPSGIIIPKLKRIPSVGDDPIKFAVDFGTTNTHIEYRKGDHEKQIEPLKITTEDIQIECLHDSLAFKDTRITEEAKTDLEQYEFAILTELMPREIGNGSNADYKFPIRTAIARSPYLKMDGEIYAMADINIPFYFEKIHSPSARIDPDLKWSNYEKKNNSLKKFIENLLLLIRNKAILSSCSLVNTEVTWFYPNSMAIGKRDILTKLWKELYNKYITSAHDPSSISESIAPFYWISQKGGVTAAGRPVLSIDIGGETTDMILFVNDNNKQVPRLATSFRFAGNAVFGDGYNNQKANNGFLRTFLPQIKDELSAKGRKETLDLLEEIEKSYPSRDVIAMLFSLDRNSGMHEGKKVSFNKKLYEDSDYKIVFLLFYTSIIYHIGKLIKKAGFDFPEYIAFTGNGSKVLNIIDPIDGTLLKELAYKMFSVVAGGAFVPEPKIKRWNDAKEMTCKGGVRYNPENDHPGEIRDLISVYPGGDLDLTYPAANTEPDLTLNNLSDSNIDAIIQEFETFLDAILKERNYLKEKFLIMPAKLGEYIDCLKQSMTEDLKLGKILRQEAEGTELTETLFFYPLIGGLNKLAEKISREKK